MDLIMQDYKLADGDLLNELEQIVLLFDAKDLKIISMNEYAQNVFGDITGNDCFKVFDSADDMSTCPMFKYGECECKSVSNQVLTREIVNSKSGRTYSFRTKYVTDNNSKDLILATATDITETAKAQQNLIEKKQSFNNILDSFVDVFFQTDTNGHFLLITPSCLDITGYSPDELQQVNLNSVIIDEDNPKGFIEQLMKEKKFTNKQFSFITKNSGKIPVSISCKLVQHYDDNAQCIEGTIRDNSNRINVERELREALLKAEEADRVRNEFVANMNHELRTPLNGILGFAQILKNDKEATTKQLEGLNIIEKSANHLLGLINDILDLSKIDSEKMELQTASFDFEEILKTVYSMASIRAKTKNVGVVLIKKSEIPKSVLGDKKRLSQVLLNLLNNAIKFTDFGKVTLNVSFKDNKASFEVIDTGYGIPQDKIDKIFMPFRQLSDYRLKSEGTGLGLPISKKIIEMMGGSMNVESTFGKGSKFSFEVELKEVVENLTSKIVNQQIVSYDGDPKTILIADDEPNDRQLLKTLLQPKGFEIIEAADGIDVLKLLEKKIPDLLLLDLIMPQLSGDDLARELRKDENYRSIPIIVISACNPNDNKELIEELELDEYILKPISDSLLFTAIKKKLNLKWNYSEHDSNNTDDILSNTEDKLVIPSEDAIRELFEAINKRNFSQFYKLLEAIEIEDKGYSRFVKEMRNLAVSFNANKIRKELQLIMEN